MSLHELVNTFVEWTGGNDFNFITRHADNLVVAASGKVSTTPYAEDLKWQVELAAYASVWLMQHPNDAFKALSTAIYCYRYDLDI